MNWRSVQVGVLGVLLGFVLGWGLHTSPVVVMPSPPAPVVASVPTPVAPAPAALEPVVATGSPTAPVSRTVYVTRTGKKFHLLGCRYLRQSQIAIEETDAVSQGYEACSVCLPGGE